MNKRDIKGFVEVLKFIEETRKEKENKFGAFFGNRKVSLCIMEYVGIGEGMEWMLLDDEKFGEFLKIINGLVDE